MIFLITLSKAYIVIYFITFAHSELLNQRRNVRHHALGRLIIYWKLHLHIIFVTITTSIFNQPQAEILDEVWQQINTIIATMRTPAQISTIIAICWTPTQIYTIIAISRTLAHINTIIGMSWTMTQIKTFISMSWILIQIRNHCCHALDNDTN